MLKGIKFNSLLKEFENGSRFDAKRSQIIRQLGELGDPRSVETLSWELGYQNLYGHKYEEIAQEIIRALSRIGGEDAVKALFKVLDNPSAHVRAAALDVLHQWKRTPRTPVEIAQYAIATGDWVAALHAGDASVGKNMLIAFIGRLPYTGERMLAIQSLANLAEERALEIFLHELDYYTKRETNPADDPQTKKTTRIYAIRGIAKIQNFKDSYNLELAIRGLIHVIGNPDFTKDYMLEGDYKAEVALALKRFERQGFDHLVESLQIKDAKLRAGRVEVLNAFPGLETATVLANMLADPDPGVRREVALTMEKFEMPELAEPLAKRLASMSEDHPAPLHEVISRLISILRKQAAKLSKKVLEIIADLPQEFFIHTMFDPGDWYDETISNREAVDLAKAELNRRGK